MKIRLYAAAVLFLMVFIFLIAYFWRSSAQENIVRDFWAHVQPEVIESHIGLVGRIEAAELVTLVAPFDGVIDQLNFVEGQRVSQGQSVVSIDTQQLDVQVREAHAELLRARRTLHDLINWEESQEVARAKRSLATARLALNDTKSKLDDTRRLYDRGIVARMEVDVLEQQARAQRFELTASEAELNSVLSKGRDEGRQIAEIEFENAQARYERLKSLRGRRDLKSPFAGILIRPRKQDDRSDSLVLHSGGQVDRGAPLFDIASVERVKAVALVQEVDLQQLREGMKVEVTGDGFSGLTLQGHIQSIGVQSVPSDTYGGGANYEVIVSIDSLSPEELKRVRLGMSANLIIITYRNQVGYAVTESAIHRGEAGSTFVYYRETMEGSVEKIPVTIGAAVLQGVEIFGMKPGYIRIGMSSE
ncbi:HlyD family secretion protein [Ectopseudomonas alcaliphila]|uniref:HlyD family secretion protein n=1 Tax=Ectopseudomonas alcaliphila TaxID=101564 RepID=UPI002780AE3A|nr:MULTISPECIES: HlyD family efflux transporter periplasmic adaptor subunit [Pseudomonas]MDP9942729.1 multidrug efflux pump subunit AcrA (membrane-fusion protein) [Pseudomonas sp. 3400]MDR7014933.1 multidrug efflux pump subunit AcrA (membrane-fusion protein) [Pseudomonas alcaliphila]